MCDADIREAIRKDLRNGNQWAWCCVKVTASVEGFAGTDYLGGCNYKDEADFRQNGYFENMKESAKADLILVLQKFVTSGLEAQKVLDSLKEEHG